jgi:hypothetical protein
MRSPADEFPPAEVQMILRRFVVGLALVLLLPATAPAQDFGVMESAETINRGNFKLGGNPMMAWGREGAEDDLGVAFKAGYGFTNAFDAEGKVALFENLTFFGGDAEFWLIKNAPLDLSLSAGLHMAKSDVVPDRAGADVTFLGSGPISRNLELYGALDFAFESFGNNPFERDFTTAHLVPGIEYAISPDLDFLAEIGLGLNDDSWHYFSAGLSFYLR